MSEWMELMKGLVTAEQVYTGVRALVLILTGLVVAKTVSSAFSRLIKTRLEAQQVMLFRRGVFYLLFGLFVVAALNQLGFNLGVLMGAAGILTVAVGFASQTSASNFISGLFLIFERPFSVGDVIDVGGTTGEVLSIDLLSVKLRTFDNLFVRVPNENLIKSEIRTLTRFPIRRVDLEIGVAYKEDLSKVRKTLLSVAEKNLLSLEEPKPLFIVKGFGDSAIDLQFSVWGKRENYLPLKSSIIEHIKKAFDSQSIEIPFPHRSLYTGSQTEPLPIRIVPGGQVPRGVEGIAV